MAAQHDETEYVTASVGGQLFGLPIARVLDVFVPARITRVPLAPRQVAGVLNLRGSIVTMIDMRARLGLPAAEHEASPMAIGIGHRGESCGLLVDSVGEVLRQPAASRDPVPVNMEPGWARMAAGVHRLDERLMVVLDVERILELPAETPAA